MKLKDLDKSNDNLNHNTTHVEVIFANEDLKIVIFQKLLNDKVLHNRLDKMHVTDSIPETYRSKAQYFDMKLKDYRDTMAAYTRVIINGVELQGWWATDESNWVKQFFWTPKERYYNPEKERDRKPKPRKSKVADPGQEGMEHDGPPLAPGVPLGDEALNELGHSVIVKVKIDMKNQASVDHFGNALGTFLIKAKIKHKRVLVKAKCFTILFESKEDRKLGLEYIVKNKPFDEFEFARMSKH